MPCRRTLSGPTPAPSGSELRSSRPSPLVSGFRPERLSDGPSSGILSRRLSWSMLRLNSSSAASLRRRAASALALSADSSLGELLSTPGSARRLASLVASSASSRYRRLEFDIRRSPSSSLSDRFLSTCRLSGANGELLGTPGDDCSPVASGDNMLSLLGVSPSSASAIIG